MLILWLIAIALTGCREPGYVTPPVVSLGSSLNTKAAEIQPHFSHDGHYLVFSSDRQKSRNVFLYDVRNRRLLPLPGLNQLQSMQSQPDISADGRYIVYVSEQLGKPDIFLYDRVARETKNITRNFLGQVRNPTISGNGRFIAFESDRSGQWNIEIYDRGLGTQLSLPVDDEN
ncbi:Periplasmic component of the Tol biopolymer transport system [Hyella patelloides LEGE 07179]|uniref:Periplasmic component of the Tol biopolymer transport system n=1 Tax=Hyella patelloides LEGE 07179 TaxID=945734 RepID=A0A563W1V1_9CYAN|nr:TolB family protein [Hyella patelloides]VEP17615.1 Periplasmic component of the Tol biopolymer transport system [Hyella patelloides LEGE 07179]